MEKMSETVCEKCRQCPHADLCTSGKKTRRDDGEKKKLMNRLVRIEGQIKGLEKMLEEDRYCRDILIQSSAVTSAVNAFTKEILANHIRNCVTANVRAGDEEIVEEMLDMLQKLMK